MNIFINYRAEASAAAKPIVQALEKHAMRVCKWVVLLRIPDLIDDLRSALFNPRIPKIEASCAGAYPENRPVRDILEVLDQTHSTRLAGPSSKSEIVLVHGFFSQPYCADSTWNVSFRGSVLDPDRHPNHFRPLYSSTNFRTSNIAIKSPSRIRSNAFDRRRRLAPSTGAPRPSSPRRDWLGDPSGPMIPSCTPKLPGIDYASGTFSCWPEVLTERMWRPWQVFVLPSMINGVFFNSPAVVAEKKSRDGNSALYLDADGRSASVMSGKDSIEFNRTFYFEHDTPDGEDQEDALAEHWEGRLRTYSYGSAIVRPDPKLIKVRQKKPKIADLSWTEDVPLHDFKWNLRQFMAELRASSVSCKKYK